MTEPALRIALLLLWAAVVSLDERAWGSTMLHQPLVCGAVAGALMGDLAAGSAVGLLFQCIWPGLLPIGGDLLPSVGLAGTVGGAVTAWGASLSGREVSLAAWGAPVAAGGRIAGWLARAFGGGEALREGAASGGGAEVSLLLGIVLGILAAWSGEIWEKGTRRRNAVREAAALGSGAPLRKALGAAMRRALLDTALRGIVITAVAIAPAALLFLTADWWRAPVGTPWNRLGPALLLTALGLGCGGLAAGLRGRRGTLDVAVVLGLAGGILLDLVWPA